MTDKQIIIDGVPVQDCCYFDYENDGYEDSCYIHQNECSAQNCYYKQLKRKEQECEELKAKCKKYGEINEQETKDYAELKAERDSYIDKYFLESQKVVNLRKILKEIKEIAEMAIKEMYATKSDDYTDGYRWLGSIILQEISECEVE